MTSEATTSALDSNTPVYTPSQNEALDGIHDSIMEALNVVPASDVLSLLTGAFVGLASEVLRREGHDADKEIKIDGGLSRDITIHAKKN